MFFANIYIVFFEANPAFFPNLCLVKETRAKDFPFNRGWGSSALDKLFRIYLCFTLFQKTKYSLETLRPNTENCHFKPQTDAATNVLFCIKLVFY